MKTINQSLNRYTNLFKLASTLKTWNKDKDETRLSELLQSKVDAFSYFKDAEEKNKMFNASVCQMIIDDRFYSKEELFNYINNVEIYKPR